MISKIIMDRVIRIIKKQDEEESDLLYWLTKEPKEKLEIVQFLIEQYISKFHKEKQYRESRKGLRRVYRITKRS